MMAIDIHIDGLPEHVQQQVADAIDNLFVEWSMESDTPPEDAEDQIQEMIDNIMCGDPYVP